MVKDHHRYNDGKKRRVTSTYLPDDIFLKIERYQKEQGLKSKNKAISKLLDNHLYLYENGTVKEEIRLK